MSMRSQAQDGEEAQETGGSVGRRAGVFTSALLDTLRMPSMRDATFGDLIQEVRDLLGDQSLRKCTRRCGIE